jgi:hypothetical protein
MSFAASPGMIFRITRLKFAVERAHRCRATHVGSRIIVEPLPDGTVWRGPVDVFELAGQPKSNRCYAWIEKRGFRSVCFTRLKTSAIRSAQTAVRAVLARRLLEPKLPSY